jgi:hypothetical protein
MHGSRRKIPSKISRPYIHEVKFLALLRAPYIYDISRLRVKRRGCPVPRVVLTLVQTKQIGKSIHKRNNKEHSKYKFTYY